MRELHRDEGKRQAMLTIMISSRWIIEVKFAKTGMKSFRHKLKGLNFESAQNFASTNIPKWDYGSKYNK